MKTLVLFTISIVVLATSASAQDMIETAPVADSTFHRVLAAPSAPVDSLYGFEIDRDEHRIKMYELDDVDEIVEDYKNGGMKWFYPRHQPDLFYPVLDSNLIPLIEYSFGYRRNPVMTSQAALAFYTAYVETASEDHLLGFMNNVDWLLDNHDEYYFRYHFGWNHGGRNLPSGWVSAMAQGEALAAISSAYFLTGEPRYLDAATGIFRTLYSNSDSTWSIFVDEDDYYWLEEYPNSDRCHVLNGILFGLWGLWDYYVISEDHFALELFQAGIRTVADNYELWNIENRNASYYCLHGLQYTFYHETHIRQFEAYLQHFDIPEFAAALEHFTRDPRIAVSTLDLNFGDVQIGGSADTTFTLYNAGTGPIHITDISHSALTFALSTTVADIDEGDSLVIQVTFSPTAPGLYADLLEVKSNAATIPIGLEGNGVERRVTTDRPTLAFADVFALASDTLRLQVTNNIGADVNIDSVTVRTDAFRLQLGSHLLKGESYIDVPVVFAPSKIGDFADTLSIYYDSDISPSHVPLTGTSLSPLRLAAGNGDDILEFGSVGVGQSDTLTARLTNVGVEPVPFFDAGTSSSSFYVIDSEGIVGPKEQRDLSVVFEPLEEGVYQDSLYVSTNLSVGPFLLVLTASAGMDVSADGPEEHPSTFALEQNYPNPFTSSTTVRYSLPRPSRVRISLINAVGQTVRLVQDRDVAVGTHLVTIDLSGLPAGIYYYSLEAGAFRTARSMVFVR